MAESKHPETQIRILLGGGIGSGKSMAGRRFGELGVTVVEADRLGHALLEPDGEAFDAVSKRWPSTVVDERIERAALAEIVFANPGQLAELEALTHPPIVRRIIELAASEADLVIEIPLILDVPGEWTRVFVDADEDMRLSRAIAGGSDETDVRRRMANQPPRAEWMQWAGEIIDNNDSIEDLNAQIDTLWYGLRTTEYGIRKKS